MNPLVSIIIPIYNTGDKLLPCLDSVRTQSYGNIEVLMVNDGSTDGSDNICREFAGMDSRFVYIAQENAGVSAARNRGISVARGEYICFVDSDDSVTSRYLACMLETIEENSADIVIQGLVNICDGDIVNTCRFAKLCIETTALSDELFDRMFHFCGPYCKLFRTATIHKNHIEFPTTISYGEDLFFYAQYLQYCHRVCFVDECEYRYTLPISGTLSTTALSPDKFWQNQKNRRRWYRLLRQKFGIARDFYLQENRIKLIGLRGLLASIKKHDADLKAYLQAIVSDPDFDFASIRPRSLSDKALLSLIRRNNTLCRVVLNILS